MEIAGPYFGLRQAAGQALPRQGTGIVSGRLERLPIVPERLLLPAGQLGKVAPVLICLGLEGLGGILADLAVGLNI